MNPGNKMAVVMKKAEVATPTTNAEKNMFVKMSKEFDKKKNGQDTPFKNAMVKHAGIAFRISDVYAY